MGDEVWNVAFGWRWMLGMEVVPAVAFIGLLFAVPESPRWLAQKGREAESQAVLVRAGGAEHAAKEMAAIRDAARDEEGCLPELFTGVFLRPLVFAVVLMACSQFCGINAIMYYSTKIFATAGGGTNAAFTSSDWVGLINLLFTFVAIGFVDRAGRRPLLLIGTAAQTVALGRTGRPRTRLWPRTRQRPSVDRSPG